MDHVSKEEKKKLRQEEWQQKLSQDERKKKFTKLAWWVGGACLILFAVWFIVAVVNTPSSTSSTTLTAPGVKSTDYNFGNSKAKVTLTEYGDFECPSCAAYYPLVKQLTNAYKDKILFIYRFFPLSNIHPNALISAQAAYAAGKQGKFWEMHDLLFAHQNDWANLSDPTPVFLNYAKQLGLNTDQFQKAMSADATVKFVKGQEQAALNLGLPGTPTFFINGKQIQNPAGYDAFKQLIDNALASAK